MSTLTITYSCKRCGLKEATVEVRYRGSDEDVILWMKRVVEVALLDDHCKKSPECQTPEVDVKIPIPEGTEWIGGPIIQ